MISLFFMYLMKQEAITTLCIRVLDAKLHAKLDTLDVNHGCM